MSKHVPYVPIDVELQRPAVRLLRALRHFDWVSARELINACGVHEFDAEWGAMARALSRLCRVGHVDSHVPVGDHRAYRINQAGRAELARRLTVDMECAA